MNTKTKIILKTVFIGIIAVGFLIPLLWMLSASLKSAANVLDYPIDWIPDVLHWENYVKVWTNDQAPFTRLYFNSLLITITALIGQLLFASMAAYAFAKLQFKGKNILFFALLASMMIPTESTIIPQFMLFKTIGLYDNILAIILPGWFNVTTIFLLRQFYMSLPDDLMEAAKLDGATHFKIWRNIYLPLTKTALISAGLLAFITIWNSYLQPLVFLVSEANYTVPLGIRFWLVDDAREYNMVMAAAASAIIPVVAIVIACQKHIVQGIAMSGSKE